MKYKGLIAMSLAALFLAVEFPGRIIAQGIGMNTETVEQKNGQRRKKVRLPKIDLSHWKVTLPINNDQGKPYEIEPPEILDFATNDIAKPYMYIDSTAGAIVFHAMPTSSTTRNTKYSRSELREQMEPGSNHVNWTFAQGGNLKARIAMESSSRDQDGKYHKTPMSKETLLAQMTIMPLLS